MKTDRQLQQDVMEELGWEPRVEHEEIGAAVVDGVVALNGYVKSFAEKLAAEQAVQRVSGIRAIANELKIRYASDPKTADHEIAKRILDIFDWNVLIPNDKIRVKVDSGWVSLSGNVNWNYQREEAKKAAGMITGVKGVLNNIQVSHQPAPGDIRHRIEAAFQRQADLDAAGVTITLHGNKVTLAGKVKSWHERQLAEDAAWAAPGVMQVEDQILLAL